MKPSPIPISLPDGSVHILRPLEALDFVGLMGYFSAFSQASRRRFGPHAFDPATLWAICQEPEGGVIQRWVTDCQGRISSYTLLHQGAVPHEGERLAGYGLLPEAEDFTLAPSVGDAWQGKGLGSRVLAQLLEAIGGKNARFYLWGGVQEDNEPALRLYQKLGFTEVGRFYYQGWNRDMVRFP